MPAIYHTRNATNAPKTDTARATHLQQVVLPH